MGHKAAPALFTQAIDENSQFEGSSRQVENPIDSSSVDAKGPQKKDMQNPAPAPLPSVDAELTDTKH
jgi:hypothetical protein